MSESEKPPGAFTTKFAERKEWKIDAGLWAAITATIPQAARVIDLGAGVGKYVKALQERGNAAVGVDGIPEVCRLSDSLVMPWNLAKPLPFAPMSDWVLCIETGEHIPKEGEAGLLENIAGHATVGAIVSWATPGQRGRDHINCLIEGTRVKPLSLRGATRRRYLGQAVTIVSSAGRELTVTPNHPIATVRGWVAAGDLREGDGLICDDFFERVSRDVVPNDDDRPAAAEEIFSLLQKHGISGWRSMPSATEDFHGDGIEGYVDIVRADGKLLMKCHVPGSEPMTEQRLKQGYPRGHRLHRDGAAALRDSRILLADAGIEGMRGNRPTLTLGHFLQPQSLTFGIRANGYAGSDQPATNRLLGHAKFLSQFDGRRACQITIDKVSKIGRREFDGHVFNLSTNEGWYIANGIVTHNCQPPEYLTAELTKRGLTLNWEATAKARKAAGKGWDHKLLVFDGRRVTSLYINIPLAGGALQVKATPLEAVGTNLKVHYQASQSPQGAATAATIVVTEGQAVDRGAFWRAWRQVGGMGQGIVAELPGGEEVQFTPPV